MNALNAKIETVNRYLNLLLRTKGSVDSIDVFRAVSPRMREEIDILRLEAVADDQNKPIEFVKAREYAHV